MIVFLIQSLLLLAVAFVIGVIVGAMARMVIATDAPAPTASSSGANSAKTVTDSSSTSSSSPQSTPAEDKEPEPPVAPAPSVKPAETTPETNSETAAESKPKPKTKKPRAAKPNTESAEARKAKKKANDIPTPAAQETSTGEPDDLKKIKGIGPQNERKLNELGITTYAQIAAWTDKDAEDWGDRLAFPGRIEREGWIAQAKTLANAPPTAKPKRKRSTVAKPKKA